MVAAWVDILGDTFRGRNWKNGRWQTGCLMCTDRSQSDQTDFSLQTGQAADQCQDKQWKTFESSSVVPNHHEETKTTVRPTSAPRKSRICYSCILYLVQRCHLPPKAIAPILPFFLEACEHKAWCIQLRAQIQPFPSLPQKNQAGISMSGSLIIRLTKWL